MKAKNNSRILAPLLAFAGVAGCAGHMPGPVSISAEQFLDAKDVRADSATQGRLEMSAGTVIVHLGQENELMPGSHRKVTVTSPTDMAVVCSNLQGENSFTTRAFTLYAGRRGSVEDVNSTEYTVPNTAKLMQYENQYVSHLTADGQTVSTGRLPDTQDGFVICTFKPVVPGAAR